MFLKQLDLFGFKSFADKVTVEFVPGITAVVGPNGSGKSNITDALRWVLGEQSAKSLRGGTMEDVIFAGSDSRKPLNVAEVAITLNNEKGTLPIDYSEVNVKRRVYRTGDSEFFINNEPCRLRDIVQLFMDSGLGKEAFSIISQGKVDNVLNSKPEERRTIFEEAAGVLKYKMRKEKAERKLHETEENVQRVNDILLELEGQLEPLKDQAEKATNYLDKKAKLKEFDIALTVHDIEILHRKWQEAKSSFDKESDQEVERSTQIQQLEATIQKWRNRVAEMDEEVSERQAVLLSVTEQLEKLEGERKLLKEREKNTVHQQSQLEERIAIAEEKASEMKQLQQETNKVIEEKVANIGVLKRKLVQKKKRLKQYDGTIEKTIEALKNKYNRRMSEQTSIQNERHYIDQQIDQLEIRLQRLNEENKKHLHRKDAADQQLQAKKLEQNQMIKVGEEQDQAIAKVLKQLKLTKEQLKQKQSSLFQTYHSIQKTKVRKESLESMSREHTGYFQGVRAVLQAKDEQLHGIEGPVVDLIRVEKKYETAIETALGSTAQHIVVQGPEDGRKAIQFLKENRFGRATFLPMSIMKGKQLHAQQRSLLQKHPSYVGIASELISFDEKYDEVIKNLLGNIVIANHLRGANELAKLLQYRVRIVTLDGEIIHQGGSMTGGAANRKRSSLVSRKRELKQLTKELINMEEKAINLNDEVDELNEKITFQKDRLTQYENKQQQNERERHQLETDLTQLTISKNHAIDQLTRYEMDKKEIKTETSKLSKRLNEIKVQFVSYGSEISELNDQIEQLTGQRNEEQGTKEILSAQISELTAQLAVLNEQFNSAKAELARLKKEEADAGAQKGQLMEELHRLHELGSQWSETNLTRKIEEVQTARDETVQFISNLREERFQLHGKIGAEELELKEIKRQQKNLQESATEKEMQVHRFDIELENRLNKLREEFTLSYEAAKENYPLTISEEEAREKTKQIKLEIDALGVVHTGAIDEYERVHERYQFLLEQQMDLLEAKNTLFLVMDEMDSEMKKRFKHTFEQIQIAFGDVFSALFGGGKAELALTDPDDLLYTGVDIVAQPPGKKLQNLSLLSGGERSMTAIALLFSILKVRPVPFCVLDEVEAALDEANIDRFSNYLKQYSDDTQFIVITHRQGTMAGADVLYGVTMQESGVSKLVSVKLTESKVLEKI